MDRKEAYQQKIEAQLKEIKAEIDKIRAKAEEASAEAKIAHYKRIEELLSKHQVVSEKLTELKEAGSDSWEDVKAGLELAWDSLSEAVKSAGSRFNK